MGSSLLLWPKLPVLVRFCSTDMGPNASIRKVNDSGPELLKRLQSMQRQFVAVGIPQQKTQRSKEPINNASLLYIHTHGSPVRHIPARPVIEPAIEASGNKERIVAELKQAQNAWLAGDKIQAVRHLRLAGVAGMNAAVRWFTDPRNHWAPNAPSTIRRKGSSKPLIHTGSLRKSITFVVRDDD